MGGVTIRAVCGSVREQEQEQDASYAMHGAKLVKHKQKLDAEKRRSVAKKKCECHSRPRCDVARLSLLNSANSLHPPVTPCGEL